MHLLSEKEKDDFTQLVNVMVSYAISYKQIKTDPHSNSSRHEATLDGSVFALDPPIDGFVCFKVRVIVILLVAYFLFNLSLLV